MLKNKKIRIARPSTNLNKTKDFYCHALGLEVLGSFEDHDHFDGVMLGHPDQMFHLEFTIDKKNNVKPTPTSEDLLVFYIEDTNEWNAIVEKIEKLGHKAIESHNPYWDHKGKTFCDPDGYRIVIQNSGWS